MKCLIILSIIACLCNVFGKVPPPEPPPQKEDQASAVSKDYTEEELKSIEQFHKDMPNLPKDTFSIVPTSFRTKRTKEQIEADKKRKEKEKEEEQKQMDKEMTEALRKTEQKLGKMSKEEVEKLSKDLSLELSEVDKKMKKGEL